MNLTVTAIRDEVARLKAAAEHQQRDLDSGMFLGEAARQAKYEIACFLKDAQELESQADEMERRLSGR